MAIPATLIGRMMSRSIVVMRSISLTASGAGSLNNSTARPGSRSTAWASSRKLYCLSRCHRPTFINVVEHIRPPPGRTRRRRLLAGCRCRSSCQRALGNFLHRPQPAQPSYPHESRPSSGPINSTPRDLRVATFCCVAGCSHIFPFIAGATRTLARGFRASATQLKASLARPSASLAIVLAVAGAMSSKSASSASLMCVGCQPSTSSYRSVTTGWRDKVLNGSAVMKRSASAVITTRTSQPCLVNWLARSAAL